MGMGSGYGNFSYFSCGPGGVSGCNLKLSVSSFRNNVPSLAYNFLNLCAGRRIFL